MLPAVMRVFGQLVATARFRAQTTFSGSSALPFANPHRRFVSKPAALHVSHFHPAWSEN